ncbi:hypothetical protein CBS147339_2771 [Penicillium roqueforti]|uniref:Genomic scaffold, ProqFM164S01 n=1 Tax=Penicillium roqueforti (strain FM164) TaxID=1365484 RepID=W6QEP0_PENRF|nr:hypothetical protein CBS147332_3521 [Penicillium roqueforti]CDM28052.1 unnamed protein product [Penicillium roqueforti FM164]KAI3081453.1 hypothetical protein CBS147339_2771 [Penicillium roqueforti]KAI3095711.1 hypothetical protein CBS147338_5696 [Penicillium roqueforti]KAI3117309.1 hypothetical protein CBS147331_3784 [Penicillium roqueforti]
MDHISTLCALSTVGIAPTGLALGRAERTQRPGLFRRKTLFQDILEPLPNNSEQTAVARPKTALSSRSPAAEWLAAKEQESLQGNQESNLRKAPLSFSGARRRRRGQTLTNPPLRIPENESTDSPVEIQTQRPSSGWLRRLSMASFQAETPTAGSPTTPSFNGSESPLVPRSPYLRRTPNKLVKRPASQHTNTHALCMNPISEPSPAALRRPATSHQRSESMFLRTSSTTDFNAYFPKTPVEGPAIEEFELEKKKHWMPFFVPKAGKLAERLSRRFSTSTAPKVQSVRQIASDNGALPVLVAANMISPTAAAPEDISVPNTPIEFRNPFQMPISEPTPKESVAPEQQTAKSGHKQSYSVNDIEPKIIMANTVTAHGTPIMGPVRGGSLKRVKGRTFSIPASELSIEEQNVPIPNSSEPEPRRNITDPSVFRAPYPTSQSGWADSALERRSQVGPRSVSQDYSVGLGPRAGARQMTSDAVALSAWQQASRPGGRPHGSLRRRPKGFSISCSDPASTVIGSDDTQVFTSCDGYETDFISDYWDSVRTRETNRSGLKGLRIETMFDKAGTSLVNEEATTLESLLPRGSFAARSSDKDPQLFTDPLLSSPPLVQTSMVETPFVADDDAFSMIGALPSNDRDCFSSSLTYSLAKLAEQPDSGTGAAKDMSESVGDLESDVNKKTNIFDWSEHAHHTRETSDSEARPKTMQGKQEGVVDRSRAVCRKAPSTVHLRSQSVPVASELPINESRQTSGKFGTWGLGTKGVSEDWDSDFDFDEAEDTPVAEDKPLVEPDINRQSMTVPKAILERQASLRGQFGQVQELTMLVEELKRLRHQANVLRIVNGPASELWAEAEQIVNLATIDDDEARRSPPGSPQSLTFSFDESDDDGLNGSSKRNSEVSWDVPSGENKAMLPLAQLVKDSQKSKSVLDILQPRGQEPSLGLDGSELASRGKKLPFDTSSLKNLVVRAGVVTRALKEVIRKADGVADSPQDFQDPPFRRIFDKPSHDDIASFEAALADMS